MLFTLWMSNGSSFPRKINAIPSLLYLETPKNSINSIITPKLQQSNPSLQNKTLKIKLRHLISTITITLKNGLQDLKLTNTRQTNNVI